jgi:hypothetical protein
MLIRPSAMGVAVCGYIMTVYLHSFLNSVTYTGLGLVLPQKYSLTDCRFNAPFPQRLWQHPTPVKTSAVPIRRITGSCAVGPKMGIKLSSYVV